MTRFNTSSDNPLLAMARRDRTVARCIAGVVIVAWILAMLVLTAWDQFQETTTSSTGRGKDHAASFFAPVT